MPLQQTSGNVTADAFGGGKAVIPNYIEDVFSTYLYTGTGAAQTITNGINLSGSGGLTWIKSRNDTYSHYLANTVIGANNYLRSNASTANNNPSSSTNSLTAFNSTGFDLGADTLGYVNFNATTYASWTFRKQPKFFDIVTYTGTGSATTIAHNLGSVPGCIIVKRTNNTGNWQVYHNGLTSAAYSIQLNLTAAQASATTVWNSTAPTSSVFSVGTDATVNASGGTYVAYIYAHNAGGFGATATDNVISCGAFTTDSSGNASVTLGYEPQWLMFKCSTTATYANWYMWDIMRGFSNNSGSNAALYANLTNAEATGYTTAPNATGFTVGGWTASQTYIYIAIRRGPMKVPTDATKVFGLSTWVGSTGDKDLGSQTNGFGSGYFAMLKARDSIQTWGQFDQLRGSLPFLQSPATDAEVADGGGLSIVNNKIQVNNGSYFGAGGDGAGLNYIAQIFRRAPGFFDEVCYTGTGSATTVAHNLGVVPELIIVKERDATGAWQVYSSSLANTEYLVLNTTAAKATGATRWNSTTPTSTVFSIGTGATVNTSAGTYVAYLFATCAGVSKVGTYTGNGTTQTINCGFTAGARFVLIKRTDSTGDWYVYDTARGMTVLTDPYLLLNSTAAEVATLGSVTTVTTGFALNSAITAAINVSGGSYIYFSVA